MRHRPRFIAGLGCLFAAAALALYAKATGNFIVPSSLTVVGIALIVSAKRRG